MRFTNRIEQYKGIIEYLDGDSTLIDTFPMSEARRRAMCNHIKNTFVEMEDIRQYWKGWRDDYSKPDKISRDSA